MIINYNYKEILHNIESNDETIRIAFFNNKAGFFIKPFFMESKYDGFFINENNFYKTLDSVRSNNKPTSITNFGYKIVVDGDLKENFLMPKNFNSLIYYVDKKTEIVLDFDMRKVFDFRNFGRYYFLSEESYNDRKIVVLKFEKRTNNLEDDSNEEKEYELFAVIISDGTYEFLNQWVKKEYEFDKLRNSNFERYVFRALKICGTKVVISFSTIKEKAIREANFLFNSFNDIESVEKKRFEKLVDSLELENIKNSYEKIVFINCVNSIFGLTRENSILAGFPWFFQNWTRDELISLKAHIILKNYDFVKKIIIKNLLLCNGSKIRISNENQKEIFEPVGILFLRLGEFLHIIKNNKNLINDKEFSIIKEKVRIIADDLIKSIDKKLFLVKNEAFETWMDSISREGFRIEIQALALRVFETSFEITHDKKYDLARKKLLRAVRKNLFKNSILIDGLFFKDNKILPDKTIRNNVFLAYYYYPKILSNKEWEVCFEKALKKLWNSWGGVSSVDKNSSLFSQKSTGENPLSYHNGDSWYFINNIAAMALYEVNPEKFNKKIKSIFEASINDNLSIGVLGSSSETSSSIKQENLGCFIQAWSNSTLLELLTKINSS
ncbi:MAG: amylo-alpha-1,6-glucosidase [Candidatus Woesearchaeota archaeon]